jgi:DNA modification methylase
MDFMENIVRNKKKHPAEKPQSLIEFYISNSSNKGDVICDPFMGCGTTARAAKKLERNYIEWEIDKQYMNVQFYIFKKEVVTNKIRRKQKSNIKRHITYYSEMYR